MMKAKTTLLALFALSALFSHAQQVSSQNGTYNQYEDALWLSEDTYLMSETILEGYLTTSLLSAYHVDDGLVWTQAAPDTFEVMAYNELVALSDSTFGVLGYYQECCDCTEPEPFVEIRSKADGSLVERIGQLLSDAYMPTDNSVGQTDWGFAIAGNAWQADSLFYFSHAGDSLTSFPLPGPVEYLAGFQGKVAVAMGSQLLLFDSSGEEVNSIVLPADVIRLSANEEVLLVQMAEEITGYDADLNTIGNLSLPGGNSTLVSSADWGFVLYNGQYLTQIPNAFDALEQVEYAGIQGFEIEDLQVNGEDVLVSGYKLSEPYTPMNIRHRYAAFRQTDLNGEEPSYETDLEITDIAMGAYQITSETEFSVNYIVTALVTVRNDGDFPVDKFYLNSVSGQGICAPEIQNLFIEDELAAGAEATYDFPGIGGWSFVNESDSADLVACVFVTNPNDEIDNDRDNDSACGSQPISLSVDELNLSHLVDLYPNPANQQINLNTDLRLESFRIFDSFGRMVKDGLLRQTAQIPVNDLPGGAYFIQLQTEKGALSKKFVVWE